MVGTLFVVATPIGNLEDITLRAVRVMREADVIAAEDTRRTAKLLSHHGIASRMVSYHAHNTRTRLPQLLAWLHEGQRIALVTDAGTPGVSDPGAELVQACVAEAIPVEPVPGVSASLTAAVASGFPLVPLSVWGFAPNRSKDRKLWLAAINEVVHTVVFFETPHRILATLADATAVLGERQMFVGRELTKLHQQFFRGNSASIAADLGVPRGEYTLVIGPLPSAHSAAAATDAEVLDEFWQEPETAGVSRRQRIAAVARKCGRPVRDVYALIERHKESGR
jgi:16S rRNA (cytidine1402-2'-O)-methyltransferase